MLRALPWYLLSTMVLFISLSGPAQAYLDPVTTSFVVQGIIGGVMAVLASIRSFRQRVFAFFSRRRESAGKAEPAPKD